MSTPFLGQIETFAFGFAPKGWAQCNGQLLPINQNQPLFALLGTTYGGDGRLTFALPDLRGRVPISFGPSSALGQRGGEEFHTLLQTEMPQHNHALNGDAVTTGTVNSPGTPGSTVLGRNSGAITPNGSFSVSMYSSTGPNNTLAPGVIGNTGGSQPHENRMPSLVINMCIALQGLFPSQN